MTDYGSVEENRVKHLEMIQAVIGRLGNDSFLVKGWAVTVAGAFFGFAVNSMKWGLALAALVPTVFFWGLDGYFLRCERLFRVLFDMVRRGSDEVEPFYMAATSRAFIETASNEAGAPASTWWRTCLSRTLLVFYGAICVAAIVLILIICDG